jgi:hypothetical protein
MCLRCLLWWSAYLEPLCWSVRLWLDHCGQGEEMKMFRDTNNRQAAKWQIDIDDTDCWSVSILLFCFARWACHMKATLANSILFRPCASLGRNSMFGWRSTIWDGCHAGMLATCPCWHRNQICWLIHFLLPGPRQLGGLRSKADSIDTGMSKSTSQSCHCTDVSFRRPSKCIKMH